MINLLSYLIGFITYWIIEDRLFVVITELFIHNGLLAFKSTTLSSSTVTLVNFSPYFVTHTISAFISAIMVCLIKYKREVWVVGVYFVITGGLPILILSSYSNTFLLFGLKIILCIIFVYIFAYIGAITGNFINNAMKKCLKMQ